MKTIQYLQLCMITLLLIIALPLQASWNNPYAKRDAKANYLYTSFSEQPKTLDPAKAYSSNEIGLIAQIYEPPLQYHYLLRPYRLERLTAKIFPKAHYYNQQGQRLPDSAPPSQVAYTQYTVTIKPKIYFQPHPAFALNKNKQYAYWPLPDDYLDNHNIKSIADFKLTGTRELTADDYIYEIKRLALPNISSPILGLMKQKIVGLTALSDELKKAYKTHHKQTYFDIRQYALTGVKRVDRYTYQIQVKGKDPQFIYWLAMPFFAPMPWEVERFYHQPQMDEYNLNLGWFPVGTGPYMLTVNNPNSQMRLERNPNFHGEKFPVKGMPGDKEQGLLVNAGKPLPFVDTVIYTLEKESIPRWAKFLQGYYDNSAISSDSFDQAIKVDKYNRPNLTPTLKNKGIRLRTSVAPSIFYLGFNMLDDVVGGNTEQARKLRQAISIAVDYQEYIAIFANGRGVPAQGPIPPGIFGYLSGKQGINPFVFTWKNEQAHRKSLHFAKKLLREAGYPNGRNVKTGAPLVLNYDVPASSGPDDKARFDWMRKQFAKLNIQLHIRATQYNRFQEKMRTGHAQLFFWGWNADYPDPENFLFLLYGKNGKVKYGGENASNYNNKEFDRLFDRINQLPNNKLRFALIQKMLNIVRRDAPWVWGFYPKSYVLSQQWIAPGKINEIANNTLKYIKLDPVTRYNKRQEWNTPVLWPFLFVLLFLLIVITPVAIRFYYNEHSDKHRLDEEQ